MPSLWVTLSEQAELQGTSAPDLVLGGEDALDEAGSQFDGEDEALVEVNAKDLAKRCLELIGLEMGLGDA